MAERVNEAQWLSTKYLRAGDEIVRGKFNRIPAPEEFRKVLQVEFWGAVKNIYFSDGTWFDCGNSTKLWIRKPTPIAR